MELKKYKLADIANIEISGVDKKTIEGETPVRLCNFVDVYYNWAITKEKAKSFMLASAKQTEIDKCSIGKGMVAITKDSETRDDIGIATYIANDFKDVLLGYHCALITPNPAIVDGKYLNAFMHTRYIQKYFENNASGSGQRYTLSNDTIGNIPVLLPSIEEQHTIGKVLADIDRKIELNKQINDNLEEQAKALFNHYFIQNTENLGEWQDGVLTDIAQYLNGLAMQKYPAMPNEAGLPVLKIKELGQGQCDTNSDRCSSLIKPEYIISDGTIIFSWSGTLLVDIWCGGKWGLNQHLFKVSSAKYPQWFVFYWTKHHLNKFIRIAKDKAVTMGHIKRCDLEISKVKIPSKQALVNLDKLFSPIFNRMVTCRIENRKLSSLRDTLLPKLMSGEISVEEVSLD